jgi:tetratricopeptide (TPR) repeat protein
MKSCIVVANALIGLLSLFLAIAAQGTEPITVEIGPGRKRMMALTIEGQKQLQKGDLNGALQTLNTVLKADPTCYPAYYVRAGVFFRQHKYDEAIQDCNEALRQDSTFAEASLLRADVNLARGHCAESLKEIDHVISIRPRQDAAARAYAERAQLHLSCPDPSFHNDQQAIKDATIACKLIEWKDEDIINTLAMACARVGDFDSAARYEEKALKLKKISPEDTERLQHNLALFKEHRLGP